MEYLVGLTLAVVVAGFAAIVGLDRGRAFYPTVLIVVASYYVLFAVMGGSRRTLIVEIAIAIGFSLISALGFKLNFWLIPAGLIAHGVFDYIHHFSIDNAGVPPWWPGFCLAFDVCIGLLLALRLVRRPELSRRGGYG